MHATPPPVFFFVPRVRGVMQLRGKNAKYDFFFFEQSQKQGAEITGLGSGAN